MAGKGKKPQRLDQAGLWEYALRALARRGQSAADLRQKLRQRAAAAGDVAAVLGRLKQSGYLDDRRFAEAYAMARLENQGFGRGRVLRDLRSRYVAAQVAGEAVRAVYQGTDEVQLIEDFLRRKYRGKCLGEHLAEPRNLAAAYRKLRYAGFSSGNSIQVLKRFSELASELEGLEEQP